MTKISVITPVLAVNSDHVKWLGEAISSVKAQTFTDWEMIVVNDHSPADMKVLRPLLDDKVRVLKATGSGVCNARNQAAAEASGELLLPLDADDLFSPNIMEEMLQVWEGEGKTCGIVYCDTLLMTGDGRVNYPSPEYSFDQLLATLFMPIGSLHRKSDWHKVGGWNVAMEGGLEDWDYWLTLGEKGVWGKRLPKTLYTYRRRADSRLSYLRSTAGVWEATIGRLRDRHRDYYNGKEPEMCRGCGASRLAPRAIARAMGGEQPARGMSVGQAVAKARGAAQPGAGPTTEATLRTSESELQGVQMVRVVYKGRMAGGFSITGRATGIEYVVRGQGLDVWTKLGRPGVDPRDLPTFARYGEANFQILGSY